MHFNNYITNAYLIFALNFKCQENTAEQITLPLCALKKFLVQTDSLETSLYITCNAGTEQIKVEKHPETRP